MLLYVALLPAVLSHPLKSLLKVPPLLTLGPAHRFLPYVRAAHTCPIPGPPALLRSTTGKLVQPWLAERCDSDTRRRLGGVKGPNLLQLKVGMAFHSGLESSVSIKRLDLSKLS